MDRKGIVLSEKIKEEYSKRIPSGHFGKSEDIYYINAHGTVTHHNDLFETGAVKKVFGKHAKELKKHRG